MSSISPPGTERAGPREWIGLGVLALPTILIALDLTVLYMAIPHLGADLNSSNTQVLWITDIYGFVIAGFLITMGSLGDRIGRRKLLLIGATAFCAASVVAAYSTSSEMLIAARALLGLAGATLMPSTLALISNMFKDAKQRSLAIGIWLTSFSVGGVIGPALGGVLLEWFWWGSVFLMAVPIMVLLLITGPLLLPEYRDRAAGRFDLVSVALSLGMILPVVWGLKEIAKDGVRALPLIAIAAGLAIGTLFVHRQRTLASPLFDLRLFRHTRFSGALVSMLLGQLTLYAFGFYFAQYLQLIEGLPAIQAGIWFLPMGIATVLGAMLAPMIARRYPPAKVIVGGLPIAAAGYVVLSLLNVNSGVALLVAGSILLAIGINPLLTLSVDLIISSAPPEKAGSASSLMETSGEMGAGLGIAVFGTVGTAIYSTQIADTMPAGVPAAVAETAENSFAGAFAAAEQLGAAGQELLVAGREAFLSGMNVVAAISAVVMGVIACIVMATLRQVPPIGSVAEAEPAAPEDPKAAQEQAPEDPKAAPEEAPAPH